MKLLFVQGKILLAPLTLFSQFLSVGHLREEKNILVKFQLQGSRFLKSSIFFRQSQTQTADYCFHHAKENGQQ